MAEEEEAAMQRPVTKKSRFDWPGLAKRAAFLLATAGVFAAGKLAAVGITLTVALACKVYFARERHSYVSFPSAETGKGVGSGSVILMSDGEVALVKRSKDPSPSPVSNLVIEANGHANRSLRDPAMATNGNANLAERKELRRSTVCSLGTWFLDEGRSIPTGANSAGSAKINKQNKAKSKAFIWHLRSRKEPPSASSTPVRSSQEISVLWNASSISDRSITERPPPPPPAPATLQRNSPSKPSAAMSVGVPGQQSLGDSALQKGGKKKSRAPATAAAKDQPPMAAPDIIAPSVDQVSVQVSSVRRGEEKKTQKATVGTSWIASGLMVIIAGLLMGRMVAIAGLVCSWYALCLRTWRKKSR